MSPLLQIGLLNAVIATGLALVAMVASRFVRRPAVVHALWVLVLLKLVTPPLVPLAILPVPELVEPAVPSALSGAVVPGRMLVPESSEAVAQAGIAWSDLALRWLLPGLWLAGALVILVIAVVRGHRFAGMLRGARPARASVQRAAAIVAARLGLRRQPELVEVEGRCSPMLWWRGRRLLLVLPDGLLAQLSAAELDSLLAHELAHVRRRDHWVRGLELLATASFWWHPVLWWTRGALHRAEEQSCDDQAVQALSGRPRAYAGALLKTVTFLSGSDGRLPALASGIGGIRQLEERLTMIMKHRPTPRLSLLTRIAMTLGAVAILLTFPTWADRADTDRHAPRSAQDAEREESIRQLEREATELERQLKEVRGRQRDIELARRQEMVQEEMQRLEIEAVQLQATGRTEEAAASRREQELMVRRLSLELENDRVSRELERSMEELEYPLRETVLEIEELEARGDQAGADALRLQAQDLKAELQEVHERELERHRAIESEMHALELDRIRVEIDAARRAGDEDTVLRMERKLQYVEERGEKVRSEEWKVRQLKEMEFRRKLEAMHATQEKLKIEGREKEAREMKERIKRLHADLEEHGS